MHSAEAGDALQQCDRLRRQQPDRPEPPGFAVEALPQLAGMVLAAEAALARAAGQPPEPVEEAAVINVQCANYYTIGLFIYGIIF